LGGGEEGGAELGHLGLEREAFRRDILGLEMGVWLVLAGE